MKKFLLAIAIVFAAVIAVLAWVFIPTHESIGRQTLNTPISDGFNLVAHRIRSTDLMQDRNSPIMCYLTTLS